MKISEARILFKSGLISDAKIFPDDSSKGWILELRVDEKAQISNRIQTERGQERVFKSSDAALAAAKAIGFKTLTVIFKD
jgi:hypothetical protein